MDYAMNKTMELLKNIILISLDLFYFTLVNSEMAFRLIYFSSFFTTRISLILGSLIYLVAYFLIYLFRHYYTAVFLFVIFIQLFYLALIFTLCKITKIGDLLNNSHLYLSSALLLLPVFFISVLGIFDQFFDAQGYIMLLIIEIWIVRIATDHFKFLLALNKELEIA